MDKKDSYDFRRIEAKWQKIWAAEGIFERCEDPQRTKFYLLEMYPYPSGRIHMGHVRNYSIGDVIARFLGMKGYNVLHPIGWDAFGMPAENAAISQGVHPQKWTLDNIAHMKTQLKRMGFNYDWSREVNTCQPDYYRWNQWIFLKMFEKGLAYRKKSWVNWCSQCQTVLANEQAAGERCWRCDSPVAQKEMEQWFLRITGYAQELLEGHGSLEKWPEHVLIMQKNWIGKSTGAQVSFPVVGSSRSIDVFTTRIDTIYGATFVALSPEHPLSRELLQTHGERQKLEAWIEKSILEQRLSREEEAAKEGIDTGKKAINPYTGEPIPIWISNYILMEYGTGAVMAVPAHDQRDFEFAKKYGLPIKVVVVPEKGAPLGELEQAFEDDGWVVNSGPFTGMTSTEAMEAMIRHAEEKTFGKKSTLYRLRDWGISRQRYWGTPIPIIYCDACGTVGVPYEDLPVVLPERVVLKGMDGSPLEKEERFVRARCPECGGDARRETDTMDTFFDSSWYYFRYCSPSEDRLPFSPQAADYWLPVDLYIGGVEHAILHLIYARFFCKVLRDLGLTVIDEPFPHYLPQGMVTRDGAAMSKSRGNVVDPDEMLETFGADTLRLFILFAAPPEKEFAWSEKGIEGCFRFLNRIWSFFINHQEVLTSEPAQPSPRRVPGESGGRIDFKIHQTIKRMGEDIAKRFHLNTAISAAMELFNQIRRESEHLKQSEEGQRRLREAFQTLVLLLSPFTPHICEELWERMGQTTRLACSPWPAFDPELAQEETVTIVVQVNGRLRDRFEAERDLAEDQLRQAALGLKRIQGFIGGREVRKVICIKNKLVNIVV